MNSKLQTSNSKLLIITYYWPPSGGPGVQRWLKFVKYLPTFGLRPVVLTVEPEQAEYPILDDSLSAEVAPEVEVHRTDCRGIYDLYKRVTGAKSAPYSGFANEARPSLIQRIARFVRGNFFLPDARRGWAKYAFREACQIIEKQNIKAIVTTGPPHSVHLIGKKIKQKYKLYWIADFRDPWSNIQYKSFLYQTRWAQAKDLRYERETLVKCDVMMMAVDERQRLQAIHQMVAPSKMLFMPNGYDEADFAGKTPTEPATFTITYVGTIAANYPTEGLRRALSALDFPFILRFVGKVDDRTRDAFRPLGDKVQFIPFVKHSEAIDYMLSSSVLLLINANVEGIEFLLHGKVFEYMASGKPILLLGAPEGKSANVIREARAGQAFQYDDTAGISSFIEEQHNNRVKGAPFTPNSEFLKQFSRMELTRRLAEIIC